MTVLDASSANARREHVRELRGQGLTYKEIGAKLGLSHSRTRQLYFQAERLKEDVLLLTPAEIRPGSPVSQLPLSRRSRKALELAGFATFGDMIALDLAEFVPRFLSVLNGDRRTLTEITALIDSNLQWTAKV